MVVQWILYSPVCDIDKWKAGQCSAAWDPRLDHITRLMFAFVCVLNSSKSKSIQIGPKLNQFTMPLLPPLRLLTDPWIRQISIINTHSQYLFSVWLDQSFMLLPLRIRSPSKLMQNTAWLNQFNSDSLGVCAWDDRSLKVFCRVLLMDRISSVAWFVCSNVWRVVQRINHWHAWMLTFNELTLSASRTHTHTDLFFCPC